MHGDIVKGSDEEIKHTSENTNQQKGFAAVMPQPTCRVWNGISLPNSVPLTGSSTPVPSGNGGEENCISVSVTAQVESSPQLNWWSAKYGTM